MDNQEFKFVGDHYPGVVKLMDLHEQYINHLTTETTKAATEVLRSAPAGVSRQNWQNEGVALRLFTRADRKHNSTFLVRRDGKFRIQFYVQTDQIRSKAVFTDGGRFKDWGEEGRGSFWVFASTPDEFLWNNTQ